MKTKEQLILMLDVMGHVQDRDYSNLTVAELELIVEQVKYGKRRKDGQEFSNQQAALVVQSGLPDSVKKIISDKFKRANDAIEKGHWKTAERELVLVVADDYVSQDLINGLLAKVRAYNLVSYM